MPDVHVVTTNIGALSNATRPLFKAPTNAQGGGCITVVAANVLQGGTASSNLRLIKLASSGTVVSGTLSSASIGTVSAFAANVPQAFTISDGFVDAEEWVGIIEENTVACNVVTIVQVSYVMGR